MTALITQANLSAPDDYYEALINAHRDLSPEQSHELNVALILLLSNHVGDLQVLQEALNHARELVIDNTSAPKSG